MDPATVLLNPQAAGGRVAALVRPMREWLDRHAPGTPLEATADVAEAQRIVRTLPVGRRIVLVGGDGTVHRMLPALLDHRGPCGLVACGSGNDLARALGLDRRSWQAGLADALVSPATPVDVGEVQVGDVVTPFASSLAAGFDASVGLRALAGPRALRGLPRYLLATLRELAGLRNWPLRVSVDGVVVHHGDTLFASVLNTPSYGSGMPAVPQARIDDGALDLLVAGRFGRLATAAMLPRLLAARHLSHPRVATRRFTRLEVDSALEVPLAGDGEPLGSARRWSVRLRPAALQIAARRRADS